jgi:hypothetical protein
MVIFQDQFVRELENLIMNMVIQTVVQRFEVNTLSFTIVFFFLIWVKAWLGGSLSTF